MLAVVVGGSAGCGWWCPHGRRPRYHRCGRWVVASSVVPHARLMPSLVGATALRCWRAGVLCVVVLVFVVVSISMLDVVVTLVILAAVLVARNNGSTYTSLFRSILSL